MAFVQVVVKCKCGKVLLTKQVSNLPNARSSGGAFAQTAKGA